MTFNISSLAIVDSVNGPNKIKGAEVPTPGNDNLVKVRKPYTISKQREKWSEEEHHKFLEALKLYGRAWRCIEEHIGTKTTIQIRSHAQKFFSKMERECAAGGCTSIHGSSGEIEIPPPRPKRRSSHPYPRKGGINSHPAAACQSIKDKIPSQIEVVEEEITGLTETKLRLFGKSFVVPENELEYSPVSEVSTGTEQTSMEAEVCSSEQQCILRSSKSSVSDNDAEFVHESVSSHLDHNEGDDWTSNTENSTASINPMESQVPQQVPSHAYVPTFNCGYMMPFPMYWPYSFAQYPVLKDDDDGNNNIDGEDGNHDTKSCFDHAATYALVASAWQSMHSPLPSYNNNMNLLYSPTALMGSLRHHQLGTSGCDMRNIVGNDDNDNAKCNAKQITGDEHHEAVIDSSSENECLNMAFRKRKSCVNGATPKELILSTKQPKGPSVRVRKFMLASQSPVSAEADHSIKNHKISGNKEDTRKRASEELGGVEPILPFLHDSRLGNVRSAFTSITAKVKGDSNQTSNHLGSNSRPLTCSRYNGSGFVPYKRPTTLTM